MKFKILMALMMAHDFILGARAKEVPVIGSLDEVLGDKYLNIKKNMCFNYH